MNNREVAHLWANQSRESAKGSSFFFEGDTLYSYGRHFPIGRIFTHPETGARSVLFTSRRYSNTTSKHQSYANSAACHLPRYYVENPCAEFKTADELATLISADKARLGREAQDAKESKRAQAKARRENVKAMERARAEFPAELEAWRKGGKLPALMSRGGYDATFRAGTALRLIDGGKYIETTRGAKVPSCVARKAWPILAQAVAKEAANSSQNAWVPFLDLPEWNWGDYRGIALRRVALGSPVELVVGCHQIPWSELELVAHEMGLAAVAVAS